MNIWSLDSSIMPRVRSEPQGNFPTSTFLRNFRTFGHPLYFTQDYTRLYFKQVV